MIASWMKGAYTGQINLPSPFPGVVAGFFFWLLHLVFSFDFSVPGGVLERSNTLESSLTLKCSTGCLNESSSVKSMRLTTSFSAAFSFCFSPTASSFSLSSSSLSPSSSFSFSASFSFFFSFSAPFSSFSFGSV